MNTTSTSTFTYGTFTEYSRAWTYGPLDPPQEPPAAVPAIRPPRGPLPTLNAHAEPEQP